MAKQCTLKSPVGSKGRIDIEADGGNVKMVFPHATAWISLPAKSAIEFAEMIIKQAKVVLGEAE